MDLKDNIGKCHHISFSTEVGVKIPKNTIMLPHVYKHDTTFSGHIISTNDFGGVINIFD